jgi:hypothetical protein
MKNGQNIFLEFLDGVHPSFFVSLIRSPRCYVFGNIKKLGILTAGIVFYMIELSSSA